MSPATSADAAELKLDGFLKFSYVDDSVTMTFDVSGYLKGATADNLTSGERARIPVLVLAMDFS